MVESAVVTLVSSFFIIVILYICILRASQYFNTPHVVHFVSIISSISLLFVSVYVKLSSPLFIRSSLVTFSLGGLTSLTSFKFLELAFAYKWTYIRQMPLKLVVLYFLALPRMPESEAKLKDISKQNVRGECFGMILQGIYKFIIFQTILYLIPFEWLATSPSPMWPTSYCIRYGLLGAILYLSMDSVTGISFGFYILLFNIRITPVFPAFPFVSTSLREFWSKRWNNLVKTSLQLISFFVIPKLIDPIKPMSKTIKSLFAYVLSGCLHEYLIWFISGKWSGKSMIFFSIHGLLVLLEIKMKLPIRSNTFQGKLTGWIWTIGIMFITSPLFFDPFIEAGLFSAMKSNVN
ncbi:unnamed protein product [Rotaria magnacalcarata]|uniref:Wax synthase domain-containing protein n=1 Tax=Rotaria magnacalcarata TaxID=392030 RepID=A0A816QVX4_9BILA|nr:unnamed protein product [Rotaria magnacalcarata]CAF2085742.1 unnamed protein product [Rotaria magnacalcarata]